MAQDAVFELTSRIDAADTYQPLFDEPTTEAEKSRIYAIALVVLHRTDELTGNTRPPTLAEIRRIVAEVCDEFDVPEAADRDTHDEWRAL